MSDTGMTPEEMRRDIQADSTQINAADLLSGPVEYTVSGIHRNPKSDGKQPWNISLEGEERFFRPCLTCRRILIKFWGDNYEDYIGRRLTLYCDPTVLWAGKPEGGVRISHLSDIDGKQTIRLARLRTKKDDIVIHPLEPIKQEALSPADQKAILDAKKQIAEAADVATLKGIGALIGKQSSAVKEGVRKVYEARLAGLK